MLNVTNARTESRKKYIEVWSVCVLSVFIHVKFDECYF